MTSHRLEVWIAGVYAGRLARTDDSDPTFEYDPAYADAGGGVPLSVSMPLDRAVHTGPEVGRWFDNLLPDNDQVRARWADQLSTTTDPLNLLEHMGEDCAGAVQVLPEGISPDGEEELESLTEEDIGLRIERLRLDASAWEGDRPGRWSLGGFQSKFTIARVGEGRWAEPRRRAPSTHVVKIGVAGLADSDIAEYATMRAASILELPVPNTVLTRFAGETAILVGRFDRTAGPDGRVRRWHQEDLCQALGLGRDRKYQVDGGPSLAQASSAIGRHVAPAARAQSRRDFAGVTAFNLLTAGLDAHAKNFALIHFGSRPALAPFYDLASTALLYTPTRVAYQGRFAMAIGGEFQPHAVRSHHLELAAADLGVPVDEFAAEVHRQLAALPSAVGQALAEAGALVGSATSQRVTARLTGWLALMRRNLAPMV
ncbi:MAG: HipA domain-containing protein [Bifidobacteriaceae bacterium]|jgi:serine/threonine-protein kinase HipA|nr:HipA domain-containing protein [Bifidobacteriaceae bacterium]